jgi:hypothetical protein
MSMLSNSKADWLCAPACTQNKPAAAPSGASATLCCLALPADMSVAQFCTFIGAYLAEVSSLQVRQVTHVTL